MGKVSVSLSGPVFEQLGTWVKEHKSNPSVVAEAALRAFAEVPDALRQRRIRELMFTKKATDRNGWALLFWEALAEEFGTRETDTEGRHVMRPRTYGGFDVIYLAFPPNHDDQRVCLEVAETPPVVGGIERLSTRFEPHLQDSPYRVAFQVAAWIREQTPRMQELCLQRIELVPELQSVLSERAGITAA